MAAEERAEKNWISRSFISLGCKKKHLNMIYFNKIKIE